jgi:hypothetical protein
MGTFLLCPTLIEDLMPRKWACVVLDALTAASALKSLVQPDPASAVLAKRFLARSHCGHERKTDEGGRRPHR